MAQVKMLSCYKELLLMYVIECMPKGHLTGGILTTVVVQDICHNFPNVAIVGFHRNNHSITSSPIRMEDIQGKSDSIRLLKIIFTKN